MKGIASILLAGIFLMQTFAFAVNELSKLDDLIEHAQMHSEEYGDSFFTFLSKHYGDQRNEHSQDHREHDELPFHHLNALHIHVVYLDASGSEMNLADYSKGKNTGCSIYVESVSTPVINRIFQPPISFLS